MMHRQVNAIEVHGKWAAAKRGKDTADVETFTFGMLVVAVRFTDRGHDLVSVGHCIQKGLFV